MNGEIGLSLLASAVGLFVATLALAQQVLQWRRAHAAAASLVEARLTATLAESDLDRLGRFLSDDIGSVDIANYVGDREVQARFKSLIGEVLTYLERPTDVAETDQMETIRTAEPRNLGDLTEPLAQARDEIVSGNIWNGLARLRRTLEIELRQALPEESSQQHRGAESMARQLAAMGALQREDLEPLLAAIRVCNRGIHGYDVDERESLNALSVVNRALTRLEEYRT